RQAAEKLGEPLDMEWAIDRNGQLFWLQARPITTIGSDLNALDTPVPDDHVLTRCNVGEIFPGASPPLTWSVVGRAIDASMQEMSAAFCGDRNPQIKAFDQFRYVAGHLFIDMTAGLAAARYTLLAKAENMAQSICGRSIPELAEPADKKLFLRRLWGIKDFLLYIFAARRITAGFAQQLKGFYIAYRHDSVAMFDELDSKRHWMVDASCVHLRSSAMSGTMEGVIQGIVSEGARSPSLEQQALAARLFAGASQVESAVLVEQLDQVVDLIAGHPQGKAAFHDVDPQAALGWLRSEASGAAGIAFADFLQQHGHRSYRELCLMTPAWADAPEALVESMQASLMARFSQAGGGHKASQAADLADQPWLIRWLLPRAHAAIRGREYTKSMMVRVAWLLKRGYRHLGCLLAEQGHLADAQLVFFFTHEELGDFVRQPTAIMAQTVINRRRAYDFQQRLAFADISQGKPQPLEAVQQQLADGQLAGRAVSRGVVEGIARVARTVAEAAALQPGEILIAPVTDVGWTPYFSLIAGLATDVGSAVSHGAVIAREYGLPCVVNLQSATGMFCTGDRVRLDADNGVLSLLQRIDDQA
ncbi:MAG TPA: PEP-utilizing enzyme, partial [Pseudomonadales bacterium]